jgi:hypothetical protein
MATKEHLQLLVQKYPEVKLTLKEQTGLSELMERKKPSG